MVRSSDWLDFSLSRPLTHEPGQHFAYCGACLTPLSFILAQKSGMGIPDFAQKFLFDPLSIQNAHWMSGPENLTPASFGLSLRPRDLAKLGYLYLKNGLWNGQRVISSKWVSDSTRAVIPKAHTNRRYDYGYLWWEKEIHQHGHLLKVYFAWGVGGQYLFVVPQLDLVCVMTGGNYKDPKLSANSFKLFQDVIVGAFLK